MTDTPDIVALYRKRADQWAKNNWVQGDLVGADAHQMIDKIERLLAWQANVERQAEDAHEYVLAQLYADMKQRAEAAEAVVDVVRNSLAAANHFVKPALAEYDKTRESNPLDANAESGQVDEGARDGY